jgi:hypothetical protein
MLFFYPTNSEFFSVLFEQIPEKNDVNVFRTSIQA